MVSKNEIELEKQKAKALTRIDNKWEAVAFYLTYRQKETLLIVCIVLLVALIVIVAIYTPFFGWVVGLVKSAIEAVVGVKK